MDCKKIQEKLGAFLEGDVSPEERALMERHLSSCDGCSGAAADHKRTGELVKGLEDVEPPPWLKQKIMARVREEVETKRNVFRKFFYPLHVKVPLEAFATVLIAVVAIYVFRSAEPEMKKAPLPSTGKEVVAKGEISESKPPKETLPQESSLRKASPQEAQPLRSRGGRIQGEGIRDKEDAPSPAREGFEKEGLRPEAGKGIEAQRGREEASPFSSFEAKQKDERVAGSTRIEEGRKALPAPPTRARAFAKRRAETVSVTIYAKDVGTAIREIENLLVRLDAKRIGRESIESTEVITAELRAGELKALLEKLKPLGEVKEKDAPHPPPILPLERGRTTEVAEGDTAIRIEIIRSPR